MGALLFNVLLFGGAHALRWVHTFLNRYVRTISMAEIESAQAEGPASITGLLLGSTSSLYRKVIAPVANLIPVQGLAMLSVALTLPWAFRQLAASTASDTAAAATSFIMQTAVPLLTGAGAREVALWGLQGVRTGLSSAYQKAAQAAGIRAEAREFIESVGQKAEGLFAVLAQVAATAGAISAVSALLHVHPELTPVDAAQVIDIVKVQVVPSTLSVDVHTVLPDGQTIAATTQQMCSAPVTSAFSAAMDTCLKSGALQQCSRYQFDQAATNVAVESVVSQFRDNAMRESERVAPQTPYLSAMNLSGACGVLATAVGTVGVLGGMSLAALMPAEGALVIPTLTASSSGFASGAVIYNLCKDGLWFGELS
jgi:hypothetical protein